jgi:GAF domain-containing protein
LVDQQLRSTGSVPGPDDFPAPDVATALTAAARLLHRPTERGDTLAAVVEAARDTVPGVDAAGITVLGTGGRLDTPVATDDLARDLAVAQRTLGEGPCRDALDGQGRVVSADLSGERRWPQYAARAREAGLRSQLAIQLHDQDRVLGVLNLYSTTSDLSHHETVRVAELFAVHAGIALTTAQHREQMNDALTSRKVIGQAIGLVMERYQLDDQRAFEFLVRISQSSNVKIRDVAQEMVSQAVDRSGQPD